MPNNKLTGNLERLMKVAHGLGDLLDHVVFVGGSVVELYIDDPGAPEVRPTIDVDCVVEPLIAADLQGFEAALEKHGFRHDMSEGAHAWRWTYQGTQVDIITVSGQSKGMENQWYAEGVRHRIIREIPGGIQINVMPLPYFMATKLEAAMSRGWDDLRISHDFEDIVFLLDSCSTVLAEIRGSERDLRTYLADSATKLLGRSDLSEAIEAVLPRGSEGRVSRTQGLIEETARLSER